MIVRDAIAADHAFIVDSNAAMALETEQLVLDRALLEAGVSGLLASPAQGRYFVAAEGEQRLGQVMITYEWSDWRNGSFWWLQSVYVVPSARNTGVFAALFHHVMRLARADPAVCGVRLYVDRGNQRATGIYTKLGMHQTNYGLMEAVFRGPESHQEE